MNLRISSKAVYYFLLNSGFKTGKKEQIGIPDWIIKNEEFMVAFLRGLFDTDGSFSVNKKNYPRIQFSSKGVILVNLVSKWLDKFNIKHSTFFETRTNVDSTKTFFITRLYIRGRVNVQLGIKLIGFANCKHLNKIEKWARRDLNT